MDCHRWYRGRSQLGCTARRETNWLLPKREREREITLSSMKSSEFLAEGIILSLFLLLSPCFGSDPDPLQDFCIADLQSKDVSVNGFTCKPASTATVEDFFFAGLSSEGNTDNTTFGSRITPGNVLTFPGVNTLGVSMNRVDIAVGGMNPPHTHPRASEILLVTKGKMLVGLITTSNVFFSKVLKAGENFVFPRGLMHFEYNIGNGKATFISAFNSQLPGVLVAPVALFGSMPWIPDNVLAKAFLTDEEVVEAIKSKFGAISSKLELYSQ